MPARGSSTPTRSRGPAGRSGPATRTGAAKKAPARKPAARSTGRSRPPARRPNPLVTLVGAILRGFAGLWMFLARGVGGLARAVGRQAATARELDPAHRRDGLGFLLVCGALAVAAGVWFSAGGAVGAALTYGVRGLFGSAAMAVPLLLVAAAVRMLRQAAEPAPRGRGVVGWTALSLGALGLMHIVAGSPAGVTERGHAGGVLGVISGGLLEQAATGWVAVPVLALVTVFGILVVTATPVNTIPARLASLLHRPGADAAPDEDGLDVLGPDGPDLDDPEAEPVRRRRPSRRRQSSFAADAPDAEGDDAAV
ncbi:MAG: cell division FtsK/SpoIIIE, partial [Cryptosporangiaceae bacterium]|nr:cell division FtsK/SpoIIIE [Cryptosporangiaceae bacterium]